MKPLTLDDAMQQQPPEKSRWRFIVIGTIAFLLVTHYLLHFLLGVDFHPAWTVFGVSAFALTVWLTISAFRLVTMSRKERLWRIDVFDSNFGRDAGWYVERDGKRVAMLLDPISTEMFWDSYRIEFLTDDEQLLNDLFHAEPSLWNGRDLVFRNRKLGFVAPHAFAPGNPHPDCPRISMRGLYIPIDPNPWERLCRVRAR